MDAAAALADLTEISSQVDAAAVVDAEGALVASTSTDTEVGERLARAGLALLEAAAAVVGGASAVTTREAARREGSVLVQRENHHAIVARTSAGPASGLVFYDLGACLHAVAEARSKPKRRSRAKKAADA